jgi:excisionase family DNA binding protein
MQKKSKTNLESDVRLLTVRDVAELDQVCAKTVRRAIDEGRLESVRIGPKGHLVRIHPAAHAAYRRGRLG